MNRTYARLHLTKIFDLTELSGVENKSAADSVSFNRIGGGEKCLHD